MPREGLIIPQAGSWQISVSGFVVTALYVFIRALLSFPQEHMEEFYLSSSGPRQLDPAGALT